ncbi:hypothetical protein CHUAL_003389 [Chamberlinius hualienensis]
MEKRRYSTKCHQLKLIYIYLIDSRHHRNNMILNDLESEAAILYDVNRFKRAGGGAIVDCSSIGLRRKNTFLKTVAASTGVKVIAGGGFYSQCAQSGSPSNYLVEDMAATIRNQLTAPIESIGEIRCGFIGEVGVTWPIKDFEKRSIAASAVVNSESGCPVLIHPPYSLDGILEVIRIFEEHGGNAYKLVIGHVDWPLYPEESLKLADENRKVYLALDTFGHEYTLTHLEPARIDGERINLLRQLINNGHEDRIVLSHDIHCKIGLEYFGGHGYNHLLKLCFSLMRNSAIRDFHIRKFVMANPQNWLAY